MSGEPLIEEVFVLVWWDSTEDRIVAVYRTLATAQAAYLDEAYPKEGPRGGKRSKRPAISWSAAPSSPERWEPDDYDDSGSGHYIERWEIQP